MNPAKRKWLAKVAAAEAAKAAPTVTEQKPVLKEEVVQVVEPVVEPVAKVEEVVEVAPVVEEVVAPVVSSKKKKS